MKYLIIIICNLVLVLGVAEPVSAEMRLVLLPGIFFFDYEETDIDGNFLDGETGLVPGISGQIDYLQESGISLIAHGGIYAGEVDYDGHAYPSGAPIQTQSKAKIFNYGVVALFPLNNSGVQTNFSIGYQFRRWERNILSTVSPTIGQVYELYEIYEWAELSFGAEIHLAEQYSQQWSFYVGVFQTRNPSVEINLEANGEGKPRLYMGSDTGLDLSAQWLVKRKSGWHTGYKLSYKSWRFRKSNAVVSGSRVIYEPESRTNIIMLELVIASKY